MDNSVFRRYELKYILPYNLYKIIEEEISKRLSKDLHGDTTIQSLYFDTDDFLLIRNSLESPPYKEKIRIRSYGLIKENDDVFLELKKKASKVVFKRRIKLKENEAFNLILKKETNNPSQIEKEIKYFVDFYQNLSPKMLLLYDRRAYFLEDSDLRITFDKNSRYRTTKLNLHSNLDGDLIFSNQDVIMEIKTTTALPIWLVNLLSKYHIYKTKFSKYGTAYKIEKQKNKEKIKEEILYA